MASFEFQSMLYPTRKAMLAAIVGEWITVGGSNDDEWVREYLSKHSDAEIAAECIEGWGLDQKGEPASYEDDDEVQSHMDEHGYSTESLATAVSDYRESATA